MFLEIHQIKKGFGSGDSRVEVLKAMMLVIYLLSKIIIEKNAHAISMTKILGYSNYEISRLYLIPTSIMVVIFFMISIPLDCKVLAVLLRYMMILEMTGWIPIYLPAWVYIRVFLIGVLSYLAVAVFEYRKIGKVPMDEALKNVE